MTVEAQGLQNRVWTDLEARYQALSQEAQGRWHQVWENYPNVTLAVFVALLTTLMLFTAAEANSQTQNWGAALPEALAQPPLPLTVELLTPVDGAELALTRSYTVTFQVTRDGEPVNYHWVTGVSTCPELKAHPDSVPTDAGTALPQNPEPPLIPLQTSNPDGSTTVSYYTPDQLESLGYSYYSCISHPDGFCYVTFAPEHPCLGEPQTLSGYAADFDGPVFSNSATVDVSGNVLFLPQVIDGTSSGWMVPKKVFGDLDSLNRAHTVTVNLN